MGSYKYATTKECIRATEHLVDCDNDGFCNACGSQARPEDFPKPKKRKPRVRKETATRKTIILEVSKDAVQNDLYLEMKNHKDDGDSPKWDTVLFDYMKMGLQPGDEIEVTAKIVSRLKRVRL
jgi:hypothetical protein